MVGKFEHFKNRRTKTCPVCSGRFTGEDVKAPLFSLKHVLGKDDRGFYGGNVSRFSLTNCPTCGAEVLLYMRPVNNGYSIHDVAIKDEELAKEHNTPIDTATETSDNKEGGTKKQVKVEDNPEPMVVTTEDLDKRACDNLIRAIGDNNTLVALQAIGNIRGFALLRKALEAAGFDPKDLMTDKGKMLKKDQYIELVKSHIESNLNMQDQENSPEDTPEDTESVEDNSEEVAEVDPVEDTEEVEADTQEETPETDSEEA